MSDDPNYLSNAAVTLSSAAVLSSLIRTLVDKNVISDAEELAIYDAAIDLLAENAGEDEAGIFELAEELIEQTWKRDV